MSRNWIWTAPATAAARIVLRTWAREPVPASTPTHALDSTATDRPHVPIRLNPGQSGAAQWARLTLERFHGAIIADAVGTGKTFIALDLVHDAIRNDNNILITTPAAIRSQWLQLLKPLPPRVNLWSHTTLHRRKPATPFDFIVVDEAHAFRNPSTRRHGALARLTHNARLLLLTATPVNNSLWDVYFLIRLFAADSAFAPLGVPSLRLAFTAATATRQPHRRTREPSRANPDATMETTRTGPAAAGLDRVLDAVLLQRSRTAAAHDARFPDRAPPRPIHYNLDDASPRLLHDLLHGINTLQLCPYTRPAHNRNSSHQRLTGADALLRLGLLKRLESSLTAFSHSLRKLETFFTAFVHELQNGFQLQPHDHHTLHTPDPDRSLQLILSQLLLPTTTTDPTATLQAVHHDLAIIRRLRDRIDSASHDPKTTRLTTLLNELPGHRRTIVFTEFVHTARALELALLSRGVARIDGESASINGQPTSRNRILQQFAPPSHHSRLAPHDSLVRTLICTDVLAEGLNLQMADTAIAFDLPWNPVRLIQRFGRIDRRDSPHDSIHLAFFTPDKGLDDILDLLDRIRSKLHAARITTPDSIDPDLLRRFATSPATTSTRPTTTTSRDHLISLARSAPAAPATTTPAASTGTTTHGQSALVALVTGATTTFLITSQHRRCHSPSTQRITAILQTALTTPEPATRHSPAHTLPLARIAAATAIRHTRRLSRRSRTRTPLTPALSNTPVNAAIRKLLSSTSTIPGGPDDETTSRIDCLIQTLSRGLRTYHELALENWLRSHQPTTLDQLHTAIASLESLLEITDYTTINDDNPDAASHRVRVVAVLLLD